MKRLSLFLLFLPVMVRSQVGDNYAKFVRSEFADFFHTAEIKRTAWKNGELREIKTGIFQDYITIYIYTDSASSTIRTAALEVDREWMGGETGADLSRDLIKSFLLDFISTPDQPKAIPAGELLFNHKATNDKFALALMDVFNQKRDSASQQFSKCTVTIENFKKEDRPSFRMKIEERAP